MKHLMKRIPLALFLNFMFSISFAQDTLWTSCTFYIGAQNTLDCLHIGEVKNEYLTTSYGSLNKTNIYSPIDTGVAFIQYKSTLYKVKVLPCPDPEILLADHLNTNMIQIDILTSGKRIIPYLRNFPFTMYISMKSIEIELLDKTKKVISHKDQPGNYVLFSEAEVKKAKYFLIRSAHVSMDDNSEEGYSIRKINCNKEYEIIR